MSHWNVEMSHSFSKKKINKASLDLQDLAICNGLTNAFTNLLPINHLFILSLHSPQSHRLQKQTRNHDELSRFEASNSSPGSQILHHASRASTLPLNICKQAQLSEPKRRASKYVCGCLLVFFCVCISAFFFNSKNVKKTTC